MQLKLSKYGVLAVVMLLSSPVFSQVTTQSPYSKFGLGNLKSPALPQFRGMGGIGVGINTPTGFNYVNTLNPASYAGFGGGLTTIDAGMSGNINTLSKGGLSERSFNGTFSHIAIGVPITRRSGLSIGLLPYSELGYEFHNAGKIDTMNVDYNYSGEGGLSKAFIGYGYQIAKGFRLGLNLEYIFGNMQQLRSTEFINQPASINVRIQNRDNVYGLNFSYGAQYDVDLSDKVKLTIGYSGSARSGISSQETNVVTRFTRDIAGNENPAIDTAQFINNAASKFKLPVIHNVGFSISKYNNWLFGADVRIGQWADLEISGVNQGLQNTLGVSVGAQWTPDIAAVSGYFKRVDYRVGFQYDKSYVRLSNTDIKQTSATFGIGLPFSSISRFTFSKFNLATEIGQRGTLSNNLVKENFINFHLGFTLNDKWFSRFKFD